LRQVERRLGYVPWESGEIQALELLAFYSKTTLRQISALREWLLEHAPLDTDPDPVDDWIRMVAINRLAGHSSGFSSVYTLPPNQAVSVEAQFRINAKRGQTPPDRDVTKLILQRSAALLKDGRTPKHPASLLITASAQSVPQIDSSSIDLVVTSPPFLDVVQYRDDNWLRCWFAGIDPAGVLIDQHRGVENWRTMVRSTLAELARVVRPGGYVAFEVGEVRNGRVLLEREVWDAAEGLPFERLFVMGNQQEFTKTANCWGVTNNTKGTNTNRIVVLRRRHIR
jgi:hypothetical protein